ncbi:MAG: KH domain-containing protein [Candidatus Gracilibacteria bacterium]|nr:KH domain-containing protein [Candidatus Gracilibacteria bacterium]MDD5178946.1 KH domain-containing protein [Candidatus Gracilibacteria bacterium]
MTAENTYTNEDPAVGPDKDFLEVMVKAIVGKPEDVIIERSVDDLGVLIKLRVNPEDMSKIVGKSGQTAKSLRTLLRLVASKYNLRTNLKILEPDGSEHRSERAEGERSEAPRAARKPFTPRVATPAAKPVEAPVENKAEGEEAAGAFDNII